MTTNPSQNIVEPKLLHLVKKIASFSPIEATVNEIVNELRSQYPEYMRKDVVVLTEKVEEAMELLQANKTRKRKLEEEAESKYDKEAQEYDMQREILEAEGLGGGLNASLRANYRQQSENKAQQELNSNNANSIDDKSEDTKSKKTPKKKTKNRRALSTLPSVGEASTTDFLSPVPRPPERYTDLGGMDEIVQQIRQLVEYPLVRPELYMHLGVDPPRGVLLRGPPGTGKTHLANAGMLFYMDSSSRLHLLDDVSYAHLSMSVVTQLPVN